jgi:chitin synthase
LAGGNSSDTFNADGASRTTIYMLVILGECARGAAAAYQTVFVAGMAMFRFICSTLYLIIRLFSG